MIFKHAKFMESEVMRQLERDAIRKGEYDATPDEVVDNAIAQHKISSKISVKNAKDDLLILVSSLRKRGFDSYADELENNFLMLKVAETHLYRVHDEDGEDILEFAHPDGDAEMADAKDGNGNIETLLTQHKKIMDVVNRQPVGKLADAAAFVLNIKQAQSPELTESEQQVVEQQKQVDNILLGLKNYIITGISPLVKTPGVKAALEGIANSISGKITVEPSSYDNVIKTINSAAKSVQSAVSSSDDDNTNQFNVGSNIDRAVAGFVEASKRAQNSLIAMKPGSALTGADRAVDAQKVNKAISFMEYAAKLWSLQLEKAEKLHDTDNIAVTAKNLKLTRDIVDVLSTFVSRNMSLLDLVRVMQGKIKMNNEDDLVQFARQWAINTRTLLKGASLDSHVKRAQLNLSPLVRTKENPNGQIPAAPPGLDTGAGTAKPVVHYTGGGGGGRALSQDELTNVKGMQSQLQEIGAYLLQNATAFANNPKLKEKNLNAATILNDANIIRFTEGPNGVVPDGKWGVNTIRALTTANKYADALGVPKFDVGVNFRTTTAQDVVNRAQSNNKLFETFKDAFTNRGPNSQLVQFDKVNKPLTNDTLDLSHTGDTPVTSYDLSSLLSFYNFLTTHSIHASKNVKFEKTAQRPAGNPLWYTAPLAVRQRQYDATHMRRAVDTAHAQYTEHGDPATPPAHGQTATSPESQTQNMNPQDLSNSQGMSAQEFNRSLAWFWNRANRYNYSINSNPESTQEDKQKAESYMNSVVNLLNQWRRLGSMMKQNGQSLGETQINPQLLAGISGRQDVGGGRRRSGRPGRSGRGYGEASGEGYSIPQAGNDVQSMIQPPIRDTMNLIALLEKYGLDSTYYMNVLGTGGIIDRMTWSNPSRDWTKLLSSYAIQNMNRSISAYVPNRKNPNDESPHPADWMYDLYNHVEADLRQIFEAWAGEINRYADPNDDKTLRQMRQQSSALSSWNNRLQQLKEMAREWKPSIPAQQYVRRGPTQMPGMYYQER